MLQVEVRLRVINHKEQSWTGASKNRMAGMNKNACWEHFPHQADIGIRGIGQTMKSAFEQAAIALTAVVTNPKTVEPLQKIEINCNAPDDELLFIEWLNSLLYEMDIHKMLFSRFEVRIGGHHLEASAWGQKINYTKHQPVVEVKGASYAMLSVNQNKAGIWTAQCVVDV